ncbi:unnamed protein product [Phytophthora lilii]|uniref:Unnamed protein product n=2 Tax=Phytophthora lilii TaxID=2077276 RepID=A0A9W6TER6_9STRA|nr:unnamed protein product [Phytophthora lilii]
MPHEDTLHHKTVRAAPSSVAKKKIYPQRPRRMEWMVFLLVLFCWVVDVEALGELDLRRALGELVSSTQESVTVQELLEGPPELTTSLPLFDRLAREERRELLHQIGERHLFGDGLVHHNATHAELFLAASAGYGSARAQFLLGTLRASSGDEAAARLYYEFAAHGREVGASMALGYRAFHGFGPAKSCRTAIRHYKFAADRVVTEQSDQKLQLYAFAEPVRLSDTEGARYHNDVNPVEDFNRAEYIRQRAGDFRNADVMVQSASITLFSDLYKTTTESDLEEHAAREREALRFLERAIEMGDIKARALLGHVYTYGLAGCPPNVTRAVELYESALNSSQGRPSGEAANGLGVVYSRGIGGVQVDSERARNLFKVAANAGHAEGVYNTGMAFLELGSYHSARAKEYFVAAAHVGHLKSIFQLARLQQRQIDAIGGVMCEEVVELYKRVTEYSRDGTKLLNLALKNVQRGNWALALELYLIGAEMGYEVAQSNAVWLIERVQQQVFGTASIRSTKQLQKMYARLVARAAAQDSTDALLRMGDNAFRIQEYAVALRNYQHADLVSAGNSAQALYSVGYMYEHGLGVASISTERASLYYHLAGEKEPSLRLVMALLQFKLRVQTSYKQITEIARQFWLSTVLQNGEPGGSINDIPSSQIINEGSMPASSAVTEFDNRQDAYRKQKTYLADSAALTDMYDNSHSSRFGAASDNTPYEYAAALQFVGDQSRLHLELARGDLPLEQQDFTIETWLRVDDHPKAENRAEQVVTLVDALDNFQLEMLPAAGPAGDSYWILRFRKYSLVDEQLPELVLSFSYAPLTPQTWNHVAVTFDATYQTVSLLLNARVKQVLSFRPHPAAPSRSEGSNSDGASSSSSSQFLAIGSNLARIYGMTPPNSKVFSGQLVHFRLWKTRKNAKAIRVLMMEQYDEVASRDLLVHLRYNVHGNAGGSTSEGEHTQPTAKRVMNGDQTVAEAHGIQFKIVEFPPPN